MNAADEKQVKEAQELQRAARELELNDLRQIAATPEGKRFFKRMFDRGDMEVECFTGNSMTFYNLGVRSVTLRHWNDLKEADKAAFIEIITGG